MQRMAAHLSDKGEPAYILNLDPAVTNVPYGANIDIRDTVCLSARLYHELALFMLSSTSFLCSC